MRTKQGVLNVLAKVYNDSRMIMIGEQCGGSKDLPSAMLDRYYKGTGKYPAVLGIDLACYGLQLPTLVLDEAKWNKALDDLTEFAEKGGIITASSHFANPLKNGTPGNECRGKFGREEMWEELLTEGTEINKFVKEELTLDAKFLGELDKRGVPVLWRPLHETNGCWFWFCCKTSSKEDFLDGEYLKRFWRYIYNYYVNELGLKNLIWVFGPNVSNGGQWSQDVLYCYPGDEYVDILGVDWYTNNRTEINKPGHSYDKIMSRGKTCAITEFGPNTNLRTTQDKQDTLFNSVDMLGIIKDLTKQGLKMAYILTWCGNCNIHYLGHAKEALEDPFVVDLEKLAQLY